MGSFNTTCAISKAPILVGQKVRVFFLVWNSFNYHYTKERKGLFSINDMGSGCYPYDRYNVIGYPLLGEYEDYNRYSFENKEMEELTLEYINKIYIPNTVKEGFKESDYNSCHDYLNIETIKDMEQLQTIEHSGSLRVKTAHGESFVAKMAIHEEIYQELILKQEWTDYFSDDIQNFNSLYNRFKEKYLDDGDIMSKLDEYAIESLNILRETLTKRLGKEDESGEIITEEYIEETVLEIAKRQLKITRQDNDPYSRNDWLVNRVKPARDIIDNKDNIEFSNEIIRAWVGGILTNRFLMSYNMEFEPVITSGQEYNFRRHSNMLKQLSDIVSGLKSRWEDEESLVLEKEIVKQETLYLKFSEIENKMNDWFDKNDEHYLKYIDVMKEIKDNNISSFTIGDKSNFDQLADELDFFNDVKHGSTIVFKE